VAAVSGPGSSARRLEILRGLFARATAEEQDFLVRLLFGELRQGALEGVLVEAVARASGVSAVRVRRAAMLAGSLAEAAAAALHGGGGALDRFVMSVFTPVQPMLADAAEDVRRRVRAAGRRRARVQAGWRPRPGAQGGHDVRVFSRNLRDVSVAVPEVVEAVRALPRARWCSTARCSRCAPTGARCPSR
jgi:DNA ligase 1